LPLHPQKKRWWSPLYVAAMRGHASTVTMLLDCERVEWNVVDKPPDQLPLLARVTKMKLGEVLRAMQTHHRVRTALATQQL
jgi:hypothetical protein